MFKIRIKINDDIHLFELEPYKKIIDLKNAIKEKLSWKKSVDLYYEDEIPIRAMGKYNIAKGIFLDIYNQFELDSFHFASKREFYLLAKEVDKTYVEKPVVKKATTGKYIAPNKRDRQQATKKSFKKFELAEDDFPALG